MSPQTKSCETTGSVLLFFVVVVCVAIEGVALPTNGSIRGTTDKFSFALVQPFGSLSVNKAGCCPYSATPLALAIQNVTNFKTLFIIGAQKGGTTWLFHLLRQHPSFIAAIPPNRQGSQAKSAKTKTVVANNAKNQPIKEPNFFNSFRMPIIGLDNYLRMFNVPKLRTHWLLDATPDYIATPIAACRLRTVFPNARFVITLKDPVHRAFSAYYMLKYAACSVLDLVSMLPQCSKLGNCFAMC